MHSLFPSDDDWKDGVLSRIEGSLLPIVETEAPLRCDRWIAASLLQKSIRRSETHFALRAASRLSEFDRTKPYRRLLIIAFEDVGAADPDALVEAVAIATTPGWRAKHGEMESLAYVVRRLAEAAKDRSSDYLISAAQCHPSFNNARESCYRSNGDNRLRVAGDSSQPLPIRALATWLASGIGMPTGQHIEGGSLVRLAQFFSQLGLSEEFQGSAMLAARRTREPIAVLVPLIWLESRNQTLSVTNEEVPESPALHGIPMYAFDKHTRLGQRAVQRLTLESATLRACLEELVPRQSWRKAAQMAAFYTDAYLVMRRLNWSLSRSLEDLGIESDFCRVGVSPNAVASLRNVMRANLTLLNVIRWNLWESQTSHGL